MLQRSINALPFRARQGQAGACPVTVLTVAFTVTVVCDEPLTTVTVAGGVNAPDGFALWIEKFEPLNALVVTLALLEKAE